MTNFKTLTELEILKLANSELLTKWVRERERIESAPEGAWPIARAREEKYWAQITELDARILELEKKTK